MDDAIVALPLLQHIKGKDCENRMRLCLASRVPPNHQGGLAAYQRLLMKIFSAKVSCSGSIAFELETILGLPTVSERLAWPSYKYRRSFLGRLTCSQWIRLASRPRTHGLLECVLGQAWHGSGSQGSDVIHFVGTGWDFFGFAMSNRARQVGARFTVLPAIHPRAWGDDVLDIRLYQQASVVICLSESERQHLRERGVPTKKLIKCCLPPMCRPDGDGNRFRIQRELHDRPCVLFLGRRDEGKGYVALLRAWKLVLEKVPEAVLILAGPEMADFSRLVSQIPSYALRDIGVPDEIEKADALDACDVFCLPSAHESFGIVYVEAWSYAKPVVCGTAPACRELIQDGVTGYWSGQIPVKLSARLIDLLLNRSLRLEMGMEGRATQTKRFNEDAFLTTHLDAFGRT
jgi:glycosyltransferase involved in cell wall biosynthesis